MKELVEKINALCADFAAEAQKNVEGNKLPEHVHVKPLLKLRKLSRSSERYP